MTAHVGTLKRVAVVNGQNTYEDIYPKTTVGNVEGVAATIQAALQSNVVTNTASAFTSANTVLGAGQVGLESDTGFMKIGDGTTAWNSLAYVNGATTPILIEVSDGNGGYTLTPQNLILETINS